MLGGGGLNVFEGMESKANDDGSDGDRDEIPKEDDGE